MVGFKLDKDITLNKGLWADPFEASDTKYSTYPNTNFGYWG